jgi:hypothetical protein
METGRCQCSISIYWLMVGETRTNAEAMALSGTRNVNAKLVGLA